MAIPGNKRPEFIEGASIKLSNVKLKHCWLIEPDTKYKSQWSVNMVLDAADDKKLTELGFNVITDGDGDRVLKAKRATRTAKGVELDPPKLVSRDPRVPFTEEVGDGSIGNVKLWCRYQEVKGETYLSAYLDALQVIQHVPKADGDFGMVDDDEDVPF